MVKMLINKNRLQFLSDLTEPRGLIESNIAWFFYSIPDYYDFRKQRIKLYIWNI